MLVMYGYRFFAFHEVGICEESCTAQVAKSITSRARHPSPMGDFLSWESSMDIRWSIGDAITNFLRTPRIFGESRKKTNGNGNAPNPAMLPLIIVCPNRALQTSSRSDRSLWWSTRSLVTLANHYGGRHPSQGWLGAVSDQRPI